MSTFQFDLQLALINIIERFPERKGDLAHFLQRQIWAKEDRKLILNTLAQMLLYPQTTEEIAINVLPIIPELVTRIIDESAIQGVPATLRFPLIVCAFSKLISITPHISNLIIEYFRKSPSILQSLDRHQIASSAENGAETEEMCLELVKAVYRFLKFSMKDFSALWTWSPLFPLLQQPNEEIRAFVCQCLVMVLGISDQRVHNSEFCKKLLIECNYIMRFDEDEARLQQRHLEVLKANTVEIKQIENRIEGSIVTGADLGSRLIDVSGFLLPIKQEQNYLNQDRRTNLVMTPTTQRNIESLTLAISQGAPILLQGPPGSGKTSAVDYLSKVTGNHNMIKIHLGDQSDAKILLGTYICTDVPGEFHWVSGALTQAVTEGRWILIEDIDMASTEVLSVLIPLLEKRQLFIPGRGEVIDAAEGFQIFATQTMHSHGHGGKNIDILNSFWTRVIVEPLGSEELTAVLRYRFSPIEPLIAKIIETFEMLQRAQEASPTPPTLPQSTEPSANTEAQQQPQIPKIRSGRFISIRDVTKWCSRIEDAVKGSDFNNNVISSQVREIVFLEAVDCFCCAIAKGPLRRQVVDLIAKIWQIEASRVEYFAASYKPQLNVTKSTVNLGRVVQLPIYNPDNSSTPSLQLESDTYCYTRHSLVLMERLAQCLKHEEPILLVGETGCGKTSTIQHLAKKLNQKLVVLNLNQQSDSADLLGGFRPVELRLLCVPLKKKFDALFTKTFSKKANTAFLEKVHQFFANKDWKKLVMSFRKAVQMVKDKIFKEQEEPERGEETQQRKKAKDNKPQLREEWAKFEAAVSKFDIQQDQIKNNFAFSFVEGALIKAIKKGQWVLLDEINLASAETLESLSGLLEGGSIVLTERGDVTEVPRHTNFRLFGSMNPANDFGKKDLPATLRNRFTEFYVDDMEDRDDLKILVQSYLKTVAPGMQVDNIVDFYLAARAEAAKNLTDGANQRPHFSLRTLSRTLEFTKRIAKQYGYQRALYEGACMSFLTQLDTKSYPVMKELIKKHLQKGIPQGQLNRAPNPPSDNYVKFDQFWIEKGTESIIEDPRYILTTTIQTHLNNLGRIAVARNYPVLLQGPTSAGKTSMVQYLAKKTGHRMVRINNHEHTDIQEYLGQYTTDPQTGQLKFQEGILVEAVRNGYWIVLDELNLAPSEVLEALNRLLDDNRELFIPDTQQVIKPHPSFMLFATQNPPGIYGGRKVLSRAFRNRFLELHFDDIPDDELQTILKERCAIPESYAKKLIAIMKDLQRHRQGSKVFAGKHGFITLRDLFKWAERHPHSYEQLGVEGYMLLAERLRNHEEKLIVKKVLEEHLKISLDIDRLYESETNGSDEFQHFNELLQTHDSEMARKVVWTQSMKRLFTLVGRCLRYKEPVLLVGETGTGKTMICELWSWLLNQPMQTLNCHQHTETQDFLGGLRPVRGKEKVTAQLDASVRDFISKSTSLQHNSEVIHKYAAVPVDQLNGKDLMNAFEEILPVVFNMKVQEKEIDASSSLKNQLAYLIAKAEEIRVLEKELQTLFAWYDGPLVQAMKTGQLLLVDEISLAEDAVLERLNSVLEPSRTLTLAEKGGEAIEEIVAHSDFRVLATMNPGGDFGKKELSPALRNRFTEIYVPQINSREDLCMIIEERFTVPALKGFGDKLLDFVEWFSSKQIHKNQFALNLRDILAWVEFLNRTLGKNAVVNSPASAPQDVQTALYESYLHGASLVLLDGLGITHTLNNQSLKRDSINFLLSQVPEDIRAQLRGIFLEAQQLIASPKLLEITADEEKCQIGPFAIEKGPVEGHKPQKNPFTLHAPTTSCNVLRLLRALQLPKPILLEGSPGVGKTTLVEALGAWVRRRVARINFSDQTDLLDLLGQDLPVPADEADVSQGPKFQWMDGVFLSALKAGDWVLLDEMNLASQSVLEGLNSCLDHRKTIFIPELNQTFQCPPTFRIFACQNPTQQGGGRKGLPKSYLNRFTKVYVDKFDTYDLLFIASNLFPQIDRDDLSKMITFNQELHKDTMELCKYGRKGSPWEFNLRDILRWCQLVISNKTSNRSKNDPAMFVDLLYLQRMRDPEDREQVKKLFHRVFGRPLAVDIRPHFHITPTHVQIGNSFIARNSVGTIKAVKNPTMPLMLQGTLNPLENLIQCVNERWMSILIGNTASMKTTLVKLLADLTGNTLHTFSINAQVDTTELLGSFEQVDLNRHKKDVVDQIQALVRYISESVLFSTPSEAANQLEFAVRVAQVSELHNVWSMFNARSKFTTQTTRDAAFDEEQYKMLNQALNFIENCIAKFSLNIDEGQVNHIRARLERLQKLKRTEISGQFEWIDGLLIRAMERGEWLVLENVNLCPSSVVDRLNPLLEPNGKLLINERGLLPDGEYASVQPHPNFRMFMVMDPKNGEISRAMRNRGIEICLLPPKTMSRDTELMLENAGVYGTQLIQQMTHFHYQMKEQFSRGRDNVVITLRSLLQWAQLLNAQLQRGFDYYRSLELSMEEVYLRSRKYQTERIAIKALFDKCFENFQMLRYADKVVRSGLQWRKYPLDSSSATLNRQASFFVQKFGQLLNAKTTDPVDALVAQLIYCGKYMMQTASSNDWSLRYNWLKVHFNNYNSAAPVLDSLVFSFEHFIKHSLLSELSGVLAKIVEVSQVNPELVKYQPVDLRVNEPLFAYLRESLLAKTENATENQQLWKYFESLLERTDVLFLIAIQTFKEQRVASQFSKKSASRFSPIEQSYEIATQRQAATSDPLLTILTTLFASLDETVQQWLTTGYPQVVDTQTMKAVKSIVRTRNELWQSLTVGNAINLSDFKLRWLHLMKQLTQLVSQTQTGPVPLALSDKLNAVVTKMNQLLRDKGSIYAKNNLWRHEGHPVIFHSEELLQLYDKLVTLAKGFEIDPELILKSRHKLAYYLDEDIKRTLVHSICSLYWLNGVMLREMFNDKASSVQQSPAKALFESLTKIPDTLSKKIADLKKNVNDPSITPESSQKYLLVPIYDHYSIVLEYFVLSRLFATSKVHDLSTVDEEIKPLLPLIERLIDFSLAYSTRAPLDLVPLQQLFWIYQPAQRDSQDLRTAREMLPALLQELFASFNNRVWNNTFNKSLAVIKEQITGGKLSAETNTSYVEGCVKLAHSVQTAFIIPLLSSWREVTIGNRDYKLAQVNELSQFLLSVSNTEALLKTSGARDHTDMHTAEWNLLTSLLTTVIHSFESTFAASNWTAIRTLLAEVTATVTDAADASDVTEKLQQLTTLLSTSDDAKFTELQSTYLQPCLALLGERQRSKKDAGVDRAVRGKAWTWLGQLRLHLLLPSLNVDPTAKYRMKLSLIDQQLFDVDCELEALTGIEKHLTGKEKTLKIDNLHDEKSVMQKLRQKLRQKVVQRPKPELFDSLFKELHSFSTTNGSKDKIGGLMKEMDDLANPQNRAFVVQQESLWQANMLYFVERLVEHYWSFRDVIQPVINAVYQIKFGVRKLLNAKLEAIPVHKLGLEIEEPNVFVREPYYRPLEHVQDVMQYLLSYSHFSTRVNDPHSVVGDGLAHIQMLLDSKTFDALEIVAQVTKMQPLIKALEYNHRSTKNDAVKVIYSLLLRVSLCKIYEHIINQNYINSRIIKVLDKIFVTFVDTWNRFQEEERARLLEEQRTFKFREKKKREDIVEIGDDPDFKTQDVVEEEKFQKSFPTFQDEFAEILEEIGNSIMNKDENSEKESKDDEEQAKSDDKKIEAMTQPAPEEEYLVETAHLRDNELYQLCKVHNHLFSTIKAHMGTSNLKFSEEEKRETLFLMYTSCAEILKVLNYQLSERFDMQDQFKASHIVAIQKINEYFDSTKNNLSKLDLAQAKSASILHGGLIENFYTAPNVAEVSLIKVPLENFKFQVMKLLEEFNDNGILIQLQKIIEKLMTFGIRSSLYKLLIGLELLLDKSNGWEQNAPQRYSIRTHMDVITSIVSRWRRLELQYWPVLLDAKQQEFVCKANRSWLALYDLLILSNLTDVPSVQKALEEFIENTSYGEFETRLNHILAFYNQFDTELTLGFTRNYLSEEIRAKIKNTLFNLYNYYKQFVPALRTAIEKELVPIQTKLKEFIKLSKWEDSNYYRLAKSIDLSHRTLNKFANNYEEILAKPMTHVFTKVGEIDFDSQKDFGYQDETDIVAAKIIKTEEEPKDAKGKKARKTKRNRRQVDTEFDLSELKPTEFVVAENVAEKYLVNVAQSPQIPHEIITMFKLTDDTSKVPKTDRLFKKMKKYCTKDILPKQLYWGSQLYFVDQYAIDIIARALQLKTNQNTKIAAKKYALVELLRTLNNKLGLSWHKAAIDNDQLNVSHLLQLDSLSSINVNSSKTLDSRKFEALQLLWDKSEQYYFKNLIRIVKLRQNVGRHSLDLSQTEVRKSSGFVEHLFNIILKQRSMLKKLSDEYKNLDRFVAPLSGLLNVEEPLKLIVPPQQATKSAAIAQKALFDEMVEKLTDLAILLQSLTDGVSQCHEVEKQLNEMKAQCEDVKTRLARHIASFVDKAVESTDQQSFLATNAVATTINEAANTFAQIKEAFSSNVMPNMPRPFLTSFSDFFDHAHSRMEQFVASVAPSVETAESHNEELADEFSKELNSLISTVLVAIQNVMNVQQQITREEDERRKKLAEERQREKEAREAREAAAAKEGEEKKPEEDKMEEDTEPEFNEPDIDQNIPNLHDKFEKLFDSLLMERVNTYFKRVNDSLAKFSNSKSLSLNNVSTLLTRSATPLFMQYKKLVDLLFLDMISLHKSLSKLEYVLVNVINTLLLRGFCKSEETVEGEGEGEGEITELQEGTGLGDGKGQKDISEDLKLEDEDKIMGEKQKDKEEKPEEQEENPEEKQEDTGIEMDAEFDGQLHDVEDKEDNEDNEDQNDNESVEHEKQMGDLNRDKEEVVDERMWNSEDEDDENEDGDNQEDTYEKDAPMPTNKKSETELGAKPEDEKKKPQKDEKAADGQDKDDAGEKGEDGEQGSEEEKGDEGSDEEKDENDETGDNEEKVGAENIEDNHHVKPKEEEKEFELDDNMQLDGDEPEEKEGEGEGEAQDGEEDMDEGEGDLNDFKEGDNAEKDEENKQEEDVNVPEEGLNLDAKDEQEEEPMHEENAGDKATEENPEENKQEEEAPNVEANLQKDDEMEEDPYKNQQEDVFGVKDNVGKTSDNVQVKEDNQQREAQEQQNEQESRDNVQNAPDEQYRADQQNTTTSASAQNEQKKPNKPKQKEPNPYRSLGDALKHWEKKLNMSETTETKEEEKNEENKEEEEYDENENVNKEQLFEYLMDDAQKQDAQTLGSALEEQQEEIPKENAFPEEEKKEEEPEQDEGPKKKEQEQVTNDEKKSNKKSSSTHQSIPLFEDQMDVDDEQQAQDEEKKDEAQEGDEERKDNDEAMQDLTSDGTALENNQALDQLQAKAMQEFTSDDLNAMREELDTMIGKWREDAASAQMGMEIWKKMSATTAPLAAELCEQLRLILEPTLKSKLQGDYRSGKRLNMRKVIPYIASNFRKDKIWLRRTKPNTRNYQVMLTVDDSESVAHGGAGALLREAVAVIATALQTLNIGEISVAKFGQAVELLHPFHLPFSDEQAARVIPQLSFKQKSTNIEELLLKTVQMLELCREENHTMQQETAQLMFVISDGKFGDRRAPIREWLRRAQEHNIFVVFLVIDNSEESILDIKKPVWKGAKMEMTNYIDEFPFPYYIILRKIQNLPTVLADALRQWFELIQRK